MPDIEIKRGYEVLPDNNVRFGIRVTNNSDSAILDVEVILDYSDSLFKLEGGKILNLGTIPPAVPRTARFLLKPLGCIHKEEIGATVRYKDHQWKKHTEEMRSKEVHCVCPFLKEKSITRAEFLRLLDSGYQEERGVNFEGIDVDKLVGFLTHTCKNRLYKIDEIPIDNGRILYMAGDAVGEKAYYLLTAVVKEYEGLAQVLLRASSDKNYGLNGFLNEILDNLRHIVVSASVREIGVIRKEQVINIIDSVVQRTNFGGGEGTASVNIRDSVVQRTEFKGDEERKKREEERLRKEREEQERLQRKREEEVRAQRKKEEQDRLLREKEAQRQIQEKESQRKAQEVEEQGRKAREERERQRKLEAENKEKELQKQRAEEERLRRRNEEIARIEREKEEERLRLEKEAKSSGGKWVFGLIIILAVLALGWYGTQDSSNPAVSTPQKTTSGFGMVDGFQQTPAISTPQKTTPYVITTPVAVAASSADPKIITNSIGIDFVLIQAGEFDMGSPSNEAGRLDVEGPVHHVKISNAFYMGKYEVTQKQWQDVMGTNPSYIKGDKLPVEQVSWNDVQDFITKLNENEGGNKYRLPTEAEWEYTARAGTKTRYSFGDDKSNLGDYAWYSANSGIYHHDVGKKKPNPWNLYDMHGNVWEWVQDNWHDNYNGAPTDGSSWESGSYRVYRGCSWYNDDGYCRSAARGNSDPDNRNYGFGFRLLRIL